MDEPLVPNPNQVRFEQRCWEHFDSKARDLEDKLKRCQDQLSTCQDKLSDQLHTANQQLCSDKLLQEALQEIENLKQENHQLRHSIKAQLGLLKSEIKRRLNMG
jgi:F0F1-type ATP synthase membrane subunit b/b'